MPRFATKSPEQQALSVAKEFSKNGTIDSLRTLDNYRSSLETVASKLSQFGIKGEIRDLTKDTAQQYLESRAADVGQSQLNMERQAIQSMLQNVTNAMSTNERLAVTKSEIATIKESRAYTVDQVNAISSAQNEKNGLSTQIAHAAGLRAHELHTLQRLEERQPSNRPALGTKFSGRDGVVYTVQGKGGLTREVTIPNELSSRLEERRLNTPQTVTDRGIRYESRYDIAGGQRWSNSFSAAANRSLGWSEGAHGVRHSYAQQRMTELQNQGLSYDKALETVSQEMGHFRPEITEVYLR